MPHIYWKYERFNKLLVDIRTELDKAKYRWIYFETQHIAWDDGKATLPWCK
jgi:ABC-type transport system substrate-binding protein